jgi:hypothetical protein
VDLVKSFSALLAMLLILLARLLAVSWYRLCRTAFLGSDMPENADPPSTEKADSEKVEPVLGRRERDNDGGPNGGRLPTSPGGAMDVFSSRA